LLTMRLSPFDPKPTLSPRAKLIGSCPLADL
jgi:hypothetical protein